MVLIDWYGIGCLIAVGLVFIAPIIRICCCCSETSSVGPGKKQRVTACAGLKFDTCTGKDEGDGGCAICLGEYLARELRATISECKHRFHAKCIKEWIKLKCTCPLCRHNLV